MNTPRQRFSLNPEALKKRLDEDGGGFDGSSDYKGFVLGDNFLRILPPWSAAGDVFREVHQWYLPAPLKTYAPNYQAMGMLDVDPVGVAVADAKRALGEEHPFIAGVGTGGGARCSKSYLANALFYRLQEIQTPQGPTQKLVLEREKPFIARVPWTVMNAVVSQAADPMMQPPILSPTEGRILRVVKPKSFEGKSNYTVTAIHVPHPFGNPDVQDTAMMERIWDQLHDLDALVVLTEKRHQKVKATVDRIYKELNLSTAGVQSVSYPASPPVQQAYQYSSQPVQTPVQPQQPVQQPVQYTQQPVQQPVQYTQQPVQQPMPTAAAPSAMMGGGATKPVCFGQHHISLTCPKGGSEPHIDAKNCLICPWEILCVKESNVRSKVPF